MNGKFLVITGIILLGIGLASLYRLTVVSNPQDKLDEIKREFSTKESTIKVNVELFKDAYLLKIKYRNGKQRHREIFFNGVKITANTFPYERERRGCEEVYIRLPKKVVEQGQNRVEIIFSGSRPTEGYCVFRNYRKYLSNAIYVLFSDSAHLPTSRVFFRAASSIIILTLLLGLIACLLGRNVFAHKGELSLYYQRYLLLPVFILLLYLLILFSAGWLSSSLGYRVVITPDLFWELIVLVPFLAVGAYSISADAVVFVSKAVKVAFDERRFDVRIGAVFCLLIIMVNLWVYWPSFFHLFRHDEWFLFFSSKEITPDLQFVIKHIDWQLRLPYDRLNFRPIFTGGLAINRVLFDTNYVGPHILTFMKHMLATFLLWCVCWQAKRSWISVVFVLLFSLLITGMDPVVWPHVDAYITTTIFILLAIFVLELILVGKISPTLGFSIVSVSILLALFTTQLALVMPFVFCIAYFYALNKDGRDRLRCGSRSPVYYLLAPLCLWLMCYLVHLYFAYPYNMTSQSKMVPLWKIPINTCHFVLLALAGIIAPMISGARFGDKLYIEVYAGIFMSIIMFIVLAFFWRTLVQRLKKKESLLPFLTLFSMAGLMCLTRASYIDGALSNSSLPSYCTYSINAMLVVLLYSILAVSKIRRPSLLLIFLFYLIFAHGIRANNICRAIEMETRPLKRYFDKVSRFVSQHQKDQDFSFKIIDRPPETQIFGWYHETCIDGLFDRFIDNDSPKYVLGYDYDSEDLKYSIYNGRWDSVPASKESVGISEEADYINSVGMQFRRVSTDKADFYISMFEVTQKQWKDVMGLNPSRFRNDDHPVENVSYHMVQEFIERLNSMEATTCYRLPTEQECAYLVNLLLRGRDRHIENTSEFAWLMGNAEGTTHPVGRLHPAPAGFYDVIGNVWEWTASPIHYSSEIEPLEDTPHVCFGGSWRDEAAGLSDLTTCYPLDFRYEHLGFRLACEPNGFHRKYD